MTKITEKIRALEGREILDSRGNPTIEVSCVLENGTRGVASVPSGASTGIHEALELRDGDPKRYGGKGVLGAIKNVDGPIREALLGQELDQNSLDEILIKIDGTENKSKLGGNAILGVSLSFARACAQSRGIELFEYLGMLAGDFKKENSELPTPMLNVINGGKHADSGLDIQEFMLVPEGFESTAEKIRAGAEIIYALKKNLHERGYVTSVGDEGGFAPKLESNEEALQLLVEAITLAGYSGKVKIALDVAASSFYENGIYKLKIAGEQKELTSKELISWYQELVSKYPIISIEDGLSEDDWQGFREMHELFGDKIKIVGDDLTVTNPKRIETAIEKKSINAIIIKPNQIGTLTEVFEAARLTREAGLSTIVSHRSGETTDTFIADLAIGLAADYLKSGSLIRSERSSKYNRLMEIATVKTA